MKILMITWNYPPKVGGMEIMLSQLVVQWRKSASVTVIGPTNHPNIIDDNVLRPKRNGLFVFFLFAIFKSLTILRKQEIDIIIAGSALVSPVSALVGSMFRKKVACQIHGLDILYSNWLYQWLIKFFLPKCDIIFANSTNTKKLAIKIGVVPSKIKIINPGLDFSEFSRPSDQSLLKRKHGLEEDFIILSAGRLAKRKGIPEFIEHSLPVLVRSIPNLLFLIAGDNPTQSLSHKENIKGRISASVRLMKLEDHVRILGHISRRHLLELYSIADVFILPAIHIESDVEGFGIVLLEAGAAGCPAVATSIGGIPDAVTDNETGILTEEGDWEAMTKAIEHLLTNQSVAESMGAQARSRAERMYDWSTVSQQYLKHFKSVVIND